MALPSALLARSTFKCSVKASGTIRPGIMVLTNSGQQNTEAVEIFRSGEASGMSYMEIAEKITKKTGIRGLTRPCNTPYFTVRAGDFAMPEIAGLIMDMYGETREDGVRRLYRFPVVFGSDDLSQILNFRFQVFTASGLGMWSDEEDGKRVCKRFLPVAVVNNKATRMPAGREVEVCGECKPQTCMDYQNNRCNLKGEIRFYIPGIPGGGLLSIPTTSKVFGFQSEDRLREILNACGGKLPTLINDKPVFWITKKLAKMSMLDGKTGEQKRAEQWLIEIEADIDMARLRARPALALVQSNHAAALLSGETEPVSEPVKEAAAQVAAAPPASDEISTIGGSPAPAPAQAPAPTQADVIKGLRRQINGFAKSLTGTNVFIAWGIKQYGEEWGSREADLRKAVAHLTYAVAQKAKAENGALQAGKSLDAFHAEMTGKYGPDWMLTVAYVQPATNA